MGTNRLTCGEFGGRNAKGQPCGVSAVDGPCRLHAADVEEAALERASAMLDPAYEFQVPPFQRLKDKVAIVGFTGHRIEALELDDSWELWGLNELYRYMPVDRFSRWFEIHRREYLEQDEDGQKHMQDLASVMPGVPIYMHKHHMDIPGSVFFPKDELCEQLDSKYFTCCPAWMIGWAIALGYQEINVYGVDMAQATEYEFQRPCCEHWLGVAKGIGIKTYIPAKSDLLTCIGLYGYESEGSEFATLLTERVKWLHEQDNERLALLRRLEAEFQEKNGMVVQDLHRMQGAEQELSLHRQTARITARLQEIAKGIVEQTDLHKRLKAEYKEKQASLLAERNQLIGAIGNAEYLLKAWLVKPEPVSGGGNIPSLAVRAADPRLAISAGDNGVPTTPSVVPA